MHYDHITLIPGHIRVDEWDEEAQDTVGRTVRPTSFLELAPFFRAEVQLDVAFTLGHLFELIDIGDDLPLLDIAVGDRIEPFLREVNRKRRSIDEGRDYEMLEVYSDAAVVHGDHGQSRYAIHHGMRVRRRDGSTCGVDLVPTYVLRDVRLCRCGEIVFHDTPGAARDAARAKGRQGKAKAGVQENTQGNVQGWKGELAISFLELVQAVFWELSFYGTPEERERVRVAMADAQNNVSNISNLDLELEELGERLGEGNEGEEDLEEIEPLDANTHGKEGPGKRRVKSQVSGAASRKVAPIPKASGKSSSKMSRGVQGHKKVQSKRGAKA